MDYQGNSKKLKGEKAPEKKEIQKVVVGEVVLKKKSLGQKFKSIFAEADIKSVMRYVVSDVLLPAARNMIVEASTKGVERMMYGERSYQRRGPGAGPRMTYNSPINRGDYRSPLTRPPGQLGATHPRIGRNDFILASKEDAVAVLQQMNDVIEMYEEVSVAELNEMVGFPSSHIDNKWGWRYLGDTQIRPIREGWLIDLPPAEPI